MDFKFFLEHFDEQCFYQKLKSSDVFHVILNVNLNYSYIKRLKNFNSNYLWKVLKGGDLKVDIRIRDPFKREVFIKSEITFTWYDNAENVLEGIWAGSSLKKTWKL